MTMGDTIKYYREKMKLTQEELGAKLPSPVKKAAVGKWEKGNVENIKRSNIQYMAKLFEISPCELMAWDDVQETPTPPTPPMQNFTSEQIELVELFNKLDELDKAKLFGYGQALFDNEKYSIKKESSAG